MKTLALLTTFALFLAAPRAEAQPAGKVWRIGILCASFCDSRTASQIEPMSGFGDGLRRAGYVDGQNVAIDLRGAGVPDDQLARVAEALVRQKVDIIVAAGT